MEFGLVNAGKQVVLLRRLVPEHVETGLYARRSVGFRPIRTHVNGRTARNSFRRDPSYKRRADRSVRRSADSGLWCWRTFPPASGGAISARQTASWLLFWLGVAHERIARWLSRTPVLPRAA